MDKIYEDVDEWLDELEGYGTRGERLFETVGLSSGQMSDLMPWLDAAFSMGYRRGYKDCRDREDK